MLRNLLIVLAGVLLGFAATAIALQKNLNFSRITVGPWQVDPMTGSAAIDPYMRAKLARTGELMLAHAEGLSLLANTDSRGQSLDSRCTYRISGPVPESRYWSLALFTPAGKLAANPAQRYGFTSAEILRAADGSFEISVSRNARPGNWLPAAVPKNFNLVLRLYDTLFDFSTAKVSANALPSIARVDCE